MSNLASFKETPQLAGKKSNLKKSSETSSKISVPRSLTSLFKLRGLKTIKPPNSKKSVKSSAKNQGKSYAARSLAGRVSRTEVDEPHRQRVGECQSDIVVG